MSTLKGSFMSASVLAILSLIACHSGTNTEAVHVSPNADTVATAPSAAPVIIAADDSLNIGLRDAIKDYPGVTAHVNNGEITLTGDISRLKLPNLMMSVNSLHPKKIVNNLIIK